MLKSRRFQHPQIMPLPAEEDALLQVSTGGFEENVIRKVGKWRLCIQKSVFKNANELGFSSYL